MWFAIVVTILAATGNNIGKALQKEAVHGLPRFSLYPGIFRQYLRSRLWLIGLAADLSGALLMIGAFALAPVSPSSRYSDICYAICCCSRCQILRNDVRCLQVSLVQPVSGLGLVSLAVFSHFHLKVLPQPFDQMLSCPEPGGLASISSALSSCACLQERLAAEEWGAVAMSMLGTIGLGVSTEEDEEAQQPGATLGVVRAAVIALSLVVLIGGLVYGSRLTTPQRRRSAAGAWTAASINGLQVRHRTLHNGLAVWGRENCCIPRAQG